MGPAAAGERQRYPASNSAHARLTAYERGWITVSECNYDILERSYYLDTRQNPLGHFSDAFLEEIRRAFAPFLSAGNARVIRT